MYVVAVFIMMRGIFGWNFHCFWALALSEKEIEFLCKHVLSCCLEIEAQGSFNLFIIEKDGN